MIRVDQKQTRADLLFDLSYGIYIAASIFAASLYFRFFIGIPYQMMILLCILLLVAREYLLDQMTMRTFAFGMLSLLLCALILKNNHAVATAMLFFYVFAARNVRIEHVLGLTAWVTGLSLIVIIGSGLIGWIPNYLEFTSGRVRQYLGFAYSLFPPTILFQVFACCLWKRGRNIRYLSLFAMLVIQFVMFRLTNARLTFICTVLCILAFLAWKLFPLLFEKGRIITWGMWTSFLWAAILSILITAGYSTKSRWMVRLNHFLGGRIVLGNDSLKLHGVRLFGQNISWKGNGLDIYGKNPQTKYNYVDNFYIQILQKYGIVFFVLILVLLTLLAYRCYQKRQYALLILLAVMAVHGIIDDQIFFLHNNICWLGIGYELFRERRRCSHKGECKQEF